MDAERWQVLQTLFHQAAELPAAEREAFLTSACEADPTLAGEVSALLAEDERASILDNPDLAGLAAKALDHAGPLSTVAFGPYRVDRLLGEGGMGVVYLAVRPDLGSVAAIKVLRDAWMSPARRERFAEEQRTLAKLTHASIARLYDAGTLDDGTPWFAMEYVPDGASLVAYCNAVRSDIESRLKLLRSAAEAVQYAHSRAVIHRDLKPSNILVQPGGSVKLLDFGIAKQLESPDQAFDATITGLRLMTPAYAAPEQLRGEPVGTYTDVYALGVILYELLTQRLPFDFSGGSRAEAELAVLKDDAVKPSAVGRKTFPRAPWRDLDVICLTAMQKDPKRRYQSAEALIRDLDHCLNQEVLEARPEGIAGRTAKFARRNWRSLSVAALVLALVAGLTLFYTARLAAARNDALAQAARTQRMLRFTLNLFNGGDFLAGPKENLRVTELVEHGANQVEQLNRDPAIQAEMYQTLGEVYEKLGNLERADTLLARSLSLRRKLFGEKSKSVAETLVSQGLLRSHQGRYQEAEQTVKQGLATSRAILAPADPDIPAATDALGSVLQEAGNYKEAVRAFEEAIRLRSAAGDDTVGLAESRLALADTYFYMDRHEEANRLYQEILPVFKRQLGDQHPRIAEIFMNIGAIEAERSRYKEAEAYDRRALEMMQAYFGKDHFQTAHALTMLARALEYQGRYPETKELLDRALAIKEKVYGPSHPDVASTLNELGNVATRQGQYRDAEDDFTRIVEIYRTSYNGKHYLIGIALSNLASVHAARGNNAAAERLFRQALAMFAETLPPKNLNEGIGRIKLGRALLRQGKWKDAHNESAAGYQIVSHLQDPSSGYLQAAKHDLAEEERRLGQ